jgi:hypothetical protein
MTIIMVFEFLIGLTDVYIAGKVSKEIQATYGFVIQLYFILIVIANALTVGTVSVVSRIYTSENRNDLTHAVFSSIITTAGAGIVLAIAGIFFSPKIIHFVNIPEELKHLAVPFIEIYSVGLLFHYILINCNGILRSCDRFFKNPGSCMCPQYWSQFLFGIPYAIGISGNCHSHCLERLHRKYDQSVEGKKFDARGKKIFSKPHKKNDHHRLAHRIAPSLVASLFDGPFFDFKCTA